MKVGIFGTGQLGRMLGVAAHRLGVEPVMYGPKSGPACDVARTSLINPFEDASSVEAFVAQVDVATYELEQLPATTAAWAAARVPLWPPLEALRESQDRIREKSLFRTLDLATPAFVPLRSRAELPDVAAKVGFPCVLKTAQGGYDGKGQARVACEEELAPAFVRLGVPCIAERWVAWRREISIIAVRGRGGEVAFYDPVENHHRGGILRVSRPPRPALDQHALMHLQSLVASLMRHLGYVGVLAVETFEADEGFLWNEIAPRVHNSGHWTLEGAETSQFENHIRAICGLPLGSTTTRSPWAMVNLISEVPDVTALLRVPGAAVHLYGKSPAPGRKLGHVTVVAPDEEALDARLAEVCRAAQIEWSREH